MVDHMTLKNEHDAHLRCATNGQGHYPQIVYGMCSKDMYKLKMPLN